MQIDTSPSSALVRRDLDKVLWPLWPALRPRMTHTQTMALLAPKPLYVERGETESERQAAQAMLAVLAQLRADASISPWQLTLGELAVLLKQEQFDELEPLWTLLRQSPEFQRSLAAPPAGRRRALVSQHPLWLVAHVAVERGAPGACLARCFELGLHERQAKEPQEGSLLLLNALSVGNRGAVSTLLRQGVRLRAEEEAEFFEGLRALPKQIAQLRRDKTQTIETLVERLEWLAGLATALNMPPAAVRELEQEAERLAGHLPRLSTLARRLTGSVAAAPKHEATPPRRQTGVFWRRG